MSMHFKIVNETGRAALTRLVERESGKDVPLPLTRITWSAKIGEDLTSADLELQTMPGLDVSAEAIVVFIDAVAARLNIHIAEDKEQHEIAKEELWQAFLRHSLENLVSSTKESN